jgi:D-serine deaminase-like pyridoxal phosphate-dependent protein
VATVVSARGSRVVLDAGSKTLGADRQPWATGGGRLPDHPGARITALSEHHATVDLGDAPTGLPLGTRVRVAPNHVCAAVNLADELVAVEGGHPARWRVHARGATT